MPGTAPRRGPLLALLGALLLLTLGFVLADWAHRNGVEAFSAWRWNTDRDASWVELTRGSLLLGSAVLLVRLGRAAGRAPVLFAWALLLVVVALDDNLALHERGARPSPRG